MAGGAGGGRSRTAAGRSVAPDRPPCARHSPQRGLDAVRPGVAALGRQRGVRVHRGRRPGLQTFADALREDHPARHAVAVGLAHGAEPGNGWTIDTFGFKEFDSHGRMVGYADIPGERTPEISWLRANPHRLHLGRIGFSLTRADGSPRHASRSHRHPADARSLERRHHEPLPPRRGTGRRRDGVPSDARRGRRPGDLSRLSRTGRVTIDVPVPLRHRAGHGGGLDAARRAHDRAHPSRVRTKPASRAGSTRTPTMRVCPLVAGRNAVRAPGRTPTSSTAGPGAPDGSDSRRPSPPHAIGGAGAVVRRRAHCRARALEPILVHRRRHRSLRQRRPALARTRAPHRAVAVPDGHPVRRPVPPAGNRADLQQLGGQVPPRDALVARGAVRAVGPPAAARAQPRLLRGHPAEGPRHRRAPGVRGRALAEDDEPDGRRVAVERRAVPRLAAAAPDLLRGAGAPRDAGRARRSSGTAQVVFDTAEFMASFPAWDADSAGASCSARRCSARRRPIPKDRTQQLHLRAELLGVGAADRAGVARAARPAARGRGGTACCSGSRRPRSPTASTCSPRPRPTPTRTRAGRRTTRRSSPRSACCRARASTGPRWSAPSTWIWTHWDWPTTWGWDYPMMAMTAARLGKPDLAVDALLMDTPKNVYRANGHNHQRPGLTIYLPGNGGAALRGGDDGRRMGRRAGGAGAGVSAQRPVGGEVGRVEEGAVTKKKQEVRRASWRLSEARRRSPAQQAFLLASGFWLLASKLAPRRTREP